MTIRKFGNSDVFRRIAKGFGANVYGQMIIAVVQLVGVPILLRSWGPQLYGEWLILFAIPSYLSMTDLGFSQSAANDMTARVARGDYAGALAVFQSLSGLVYLVAGGGAVIAGVLAVGLPLKLWFHFVTLTTFQVRIVLWLLAAEVLVKLCDGVNHAGFRSAGEFHVHVGIYYTTLLLQNVGVWVIALIGYGPDTAAAVYFGVRILQVPGTAALLVHRHRFLRLGFANAKSEHLRLLVRPAIANTAVPLADAFNIQGMVLAVGQVMGPVALVTFSTLRTLTRLLAQAVGTISNAVEPESAAAYGREDRGAMRGLFVRTLGVQLIVSLAGLVVLVIVGSRLLQFWTHGRVLMDASLFHWLLFAAVTTVLWHSALTVLKSANRHVRASLWYMVLSALAVVTSWILLGRLGHLTGAGEVLLALNVATALYILPAAWRLVNRSPEKVPSGEKFIAERRRSS